MFISLAVLSAYSNCLEVGKQVVYMAVVLSPWKGGSSKWAGVEVYTEEC